MFGKKKEEMMVYVIMGFLEAGKTNLIRDLVVDDMFDDKIKTMILACEEGELVKSSKTGREELYERFYTGISFFWSVYQFVYL